MSLWENSETHQFNDCRIWGVPITLQNNYVEHWRQQDILEMQDKSLMVWGHIVLGNSKIGDRTFFNCSKRQADILNMGSISIPKQEMEIW